VVPRHPNISSTAAVAVFSAAIACVVLACASQPKLTAGESAQAALVKLSDAVLTDVRDRSRAQEMLAVVEQLRKEDREARSAVAAYRSRLQMLNANYDATEGEFRRLFAEFDGERRTRQDRIVGLWITMARLTTDSEWEALAEARTTAAEALLTPG
jgi:uncharacterized protein YhaN